MTTTNEALLIQQLKEVASLMESNPQGVRHPWIPGTHARPLLEKIRVTLETVAASAQAEPVLQDIEQYRLQMAAISTASFGYWKVGDDIRPDYETQSLRDVADLYAKYDELHKLVHGPAQVVAIQDGLRTSLFDLLWGHKHGGLDNAQAVFDLFKKALAAAASLPQPSEQTATLYSQVKAAQANVATWPEFVQKATTFAPPAKQATGDDLAFTMAVPSKSHVRQRMQERCQHDYKTSFTLGGAICAKCGKIEPPPAKQAEQTNVTYMKPDPNAVVALALSGVLPDQQAEQILRDAFSRAEQPQQLSDEQMIAMPSLPKAFHLCGKDLNSLQTYYSPAQVRDYALKCVRAAMSGKDAKQQGGEKPQGRQK